LLQSTNFSIDECKKIKRLLFTNPPLENIEIAKIMDCHPSVILRIKKAAFLSYRQKNNLIKELTK
jgi:hypothetical protein